MTVEPFADFPASAEFEDPAVARERMVINEMERMQIREEARRRIAAESSTVSELPALSNLADRLAAPRTRPRWRIQDMWPAGGRINLVGAPKAGKTTMTTNVVRALVDGGHFLGKYTTEAVPDCEGPAVVVFDFEMTEDMLLDWYEDAGITNTHKVETVLLNGLGSGFDFTNPAVRAELVKRYGGAHTYILDPVGPLLASLGLDENSNSDVQRLLTAWDEFVRELGGQESMVTMHAGHNGERARGASAFLGSCSAVWTLMREGEEPGAPRFLKTMGRIEGMPKTRLAVQGRTLTILGHLTPEKIADAKGEQILDYLATVCEWQGRDRIRSKVGGSQPTVTQALRELVDSGQVLHDNKKGYGLPHWLS